jgi:hypothetical protein
LFKLKNGKVKLGMVAHICNPALGRLGQKDLEFKASLSCSKTLSQPKYINKKGKVMKPFEKVVENFYNKWF